MTSVDVLVVEDDDSVADVIEYALGLRGLQIKRIVNGIEASSALCEGNLRTRSVLLMSVCQVWTVSGYRPAAGLGFPRQDPSHHVDGQSQ